MTQPVSPEHVLLQSLREAPYGLTLEECWVVLRPYVGRTRLERAVQSVRETTQVYESVEMRLNRSNRPERQRVLRISSSQDAETTALPTTGPVAAPARPALLVVTQGPRVGTQFALEGQRNTIGRHPRSSIRLGDATISRNHAEIRYHEGRYRLDDVGSRNGTYVNRVKVKQATLSGGDAIDMGVFRLTLVTSTDAGPGCP